MHIKEDPKTGFPFLEAPGVGSTEHAASSGNLYSRIQAFKTESALYIEKLIDKEEISFFSSLYQYITDLHVRKQGGPLVEFDDEKEAFFKRDLRKTTEYIRRFTGLHPESARITKDILGLEELLFGESYFKTNLYGSGEKDTVESS